MTDIAEPTVAPIAQGPIVAHAGRYYRNARYIMVVALFIFAGWFAYDGYVVWPQRNNKIDQVNAAYDNAITDADKAKFGQMQQQLGAKKTDTDIGLQKKLAFGLPIAAIAYLVYVLRKSRGEIRLEDETLYVPGHPPIPLNAFRSMDNASWDKKGVATAAYDVDGKTGTITLDDFVYQQKPIDAIYDILSKRLKSSQQL